MEPMDRNTVREQLKNTAAADFIKAHTKTALAEKAALLGADTSAAKTKQDIYDAMIASASLPDLSLRGRSQIQAPVSAVWELADEMVAGAADGKKARRKDVVAAAVAQGIAFYTARTQYQAWFQASHRGTRRLAEIPQDELPQTLKAEGVTA